MGNVCCAKPQGNPEDIREKYILGDVLGSGSFGQVRLGTLKSDPSIQRAVKIIELDSGDGEIDLGEDGKIASVMEEVKTMMALDHPGIIKFYEFYEDPAFMYVVMEYCCGGEIFDKLLELKRFTEEHASMMAKWMLDALVYLHQRRVVHRDIKAENFIFATKNLEDGIKMIDFGMAAHLEPGENNFLKDLCGSPHYLAPEIIGQKYQEGVDIWSLGVLMYLLLYGFYPFDASSTSQLMMNILTDSIKFNHPHKPSPAAIAFISGCLQRMPKKRMSAEQAIADPWITRQNLTPESANPMVDKKRLESARKLSIVHRPQVDQAVDQERTRKLSVMDQQWATGRSEAVHVPVMEGTPEKPGDTVGSQPQYQNKQRKQSVLVQMMAKGRSPSSVVPVPGNEPAGASNYGKGPMIGGPNRTQSKMGAGRRLSYAVGKKKDTIEDSEVQDMHKLYNQMPAGVGEE